MGEIADHYVDRMIEQGWNPEQELRSPKPKAPRCPSCGRHPKRTNTQYGIKRECCGLWAWGKTAPLVDRETHQARQYAHRVFDSLWQSGLVSRTRAYKLLAEELGIDPADCHMKLMDKETARRVPFAAHDIGKRLKETG